MFVNITRRSEPGAEFLTGLNRMMDEAFGVTRNGTTVAATWAPACDVYEDEGNLKVVLELPGLKPEDLKIGIENQRLTIQGEKRQETKTSFDRWHRFERTFGRFERTFALPNTVDVDGIVARAEHGVLTLTLPKAERAKPRQIPVTR